MHRFTKVVFTVLLVCTAHAGAQSLRTIPLKVRDMLYDPGTRLIYAVTLGTAGSAANSVVAIDPFTGQTHAPIYIGSEPSRIILSDSAKYLYIALEGANAVRKFDIATQKPGAQVSLGAGITASDLAPVAGNPEAFVVMRQNRSYSSGDNGTVVFENGAAKPDIVYAGHSIAVGFPPSRLYSYESYISSWDMHIMQVGKTGLKNVGNANGTLNGNASLFADNGVIYTDNGKIIDPEGRAVLGTLPGLAERSVICPDSATGSVYAATGELDKVKITAYDIRTFKVVGIQSVPMTWQSDPSHLIRWGADGLAFIAGDKVCIFRSTIIPARLPSVDLSVTRGDVPRIAAGSAGLDYSITVTNKGAQTATGVILTEILPESVSVMGVKTSQGSAGCTAGIVRADLGKLKAHAGVKLTITLDPAKGTPLTATSVVRCDQPDSKPDDNLASWGGEVGVVNGHGVDLTGVWTIPLPVSDMIYDPGTRLIYAVTPGTAAPTANSVVAIDPFTGKLHAPIYIGSEPRRIILSDSSKYLYIALDGANAVRKFDIATQKPGAQVSLGTGNTASDLAPVAGNPEAFVVMRQNCYRGPSDEGTVVFENGAAKPDIVYAGHSIAVGFPPSRYYSYEWMISSYDMHIMQIGKTGLKNVGNANGTLSGNARLFAGNGVIYTDSGKIIDPEGRAVLGTLTGLTWGSVICPDSATGRVYAASGDSGMAKITAYNNRSFKEAGVQSVPMTGEGAPTLLIRWGADGFAFIAGDKVYILRSRIIPAKLPSVDLSVMRGDMPRSAAGAVGVKYTITVLNKGAQTATGVILTEILPESVGVMGVKSSQGSAGCTAGIVRADIGVLKAHARATLTVTLDPAKGAPLTATSIVRCDKPDSKPDDNLSSWGGKAGVVKEQEIDLAGEWKKLSRSITGSGIFMKTTISGTFIVRNVGNFAAPASMLRFYLSSNRSTEWPAEEFQQISLPALKPGEAFTFMLRAELKRRGDAAGLYVIAVVNATRAFPEIDMRNNLVPSKPIP